MFIELNETRVNTDHIISYDISNKDATKLLICFVDGEINTTKYETEEEAKLTLYALDRAIGVKPIIIRK